MRKLSSDSLPSLSDGIKRFINSGIYGFFWGEADGLVGDHYILRTDKGMVFVLDEDGAIFLENSELKIRPKDTVYFELPPSSEHVNFLRCSY